MNLIKYKGFEDQEYIYFWVKDGERKQVLSPFFTSEEMAKEWMDEICADLGLINMTKVDDSHPIIIQPGPKVEIDMGDVSDAANDANQNSTK